MTQSSIVGKVVGVPTCPDPHHTGLRFSIDTGTARHDFGVCGHSEFEQSPLAALAMSAALAAAAQRGFDVQVIYDQEFPHVALAIELPYPNPNHPAQGGDTLSNPYRERVNTMTVFDFGGGPGIETELSWAGASGSIYFGSTDAEQVVEWATLLARAVTLDAQVTVDWTLPMRNADRLINKLTLDESSL